MIHFATAAVRFGMTCNNEERPAIGIGACLNGQPVRYNGDSKRSSVPLEALREALHFTSFCPEMAIGLGVPREPIRLVDEKGDLKLRTAGRGDLDYGPAMHRYAREVLDAQPKLSGYILVKGSPSCGYERVKRYNTQGNLLGRDSRGYFAEALRQLDPLLPLEDDGRLCDPALRESFLCRIYVYHRWRVLLGQGLSVSGLLEFYSANKYLIMSRDYQTVRRLGQLLANAGNENLETLAETFISIVMQALSKPANRRSHSNALQHVQGYLRKYLSSPERVEMADIIERYRQGELPLVVPITLLRHHFRNSPDPYINRQSFLYPYPDTLQLRNLI